MPPVQSTEEKRFQEYQITSKAPENSDTFSSPSISNPNRIIPFFSRNYSADSIAPSTTRRTPSGRTPARGTSARRNTD